LGGKRRRRISLGLESINHFPIIFITRKISKHLN
jgi:hypothetical protein